MADILYVKDLQVKATIGVPAWEQHIKQTISIDFEVVTDAAKAASADDIDATLNYQLIAERLTTFIAASQYTLIETLAENCAQLILSEFATSWVKLRMSKPFIVAGAKDAGIVIERGVKPKD